MHAISSWLCPKAVPRSPITPTTVKVCPLSLMTRPIGDSCGKSRCLDRLADHEHAAAQRDIFVVQIAAVGEGVGVGDEETLVRPDDRQAGSGLDAVVNRLLAVVENLQANLLRIALHQLGVALRLAISDVAAVLVFLANRVRRRSRWPDISRTGKCSNQKASGRFRSKPASRRSRSSPRSRKRRRS